MHPRIRTTRRPRTALLAAVAVLATLLPVALPASAALEPDHDTVDLGDIRADDEGRSKSRNVVVLTNTGGSDVTINSLSVSGGNGQFSVQSGVGGTVVAAGGETSFWVEFAPTSPGSKSATLNVNASGSGNSPSIPLVGRGVDSDIWYRINAGGNYRQGTVDWVRESPTAPSPYLNATDIGNTVRPPGTITSMDNTVPSGTPIELFETHRYDPPGGDAMSWNFPVDSGSYEVRLYFAETEDINAGGRVFDVLLEGDVVLNDFDVVAATGQAEGTMRAFIVGADDGVVDLDFNRVTQNPFISAIEIIERPDDTEPPPSPTPVGDVSSLGASPSSLSFGTAAIGGSISRTVTITNMGDSNDTTVTLDPSISGGDSPSFTITSGGDERTLSPGNSTDITISFSPKSSGSKSATLVLDHDGDNDPLQVALSGSGAGGSSGFTDIGGSIFQTEINWLASSGITKGCNPPANTLFCPEDEVTRGQMAAFLHRALEGVLTPSGSVEFVDDDSSVFEADIEWLGATGVTLGCNPPDNSEFCPDDPVTRGQMAAFLHRALEDVLEPGAPSQFEDDDSSVFESDIEWLAATGVTKGCNPPANTNFCPDDAVTREQMAAFLFRALGGG